MRNLVVCCDGTWNAPDNSDHGVPAPTNVRRLYNALVENDTQLTRYQSGVGTAGFLDKLGGLFGLGISVDIMDTYYWLCDKFEPGDQIYLFGFSRGAFTARSLGGLISKYGLLDFSGIDDASDRSTLVKHVYNDGYKKGGVTASSLESNFSKLSFFANSNKIQFIGAWDTVGALGVPDDISILDLFDNPKHYQFHDVSLNKNVSHARHAIAIDETRNSFTPTLWENAEGESEADFNSRVKQIWFPGSHNDVGGGHKENGLSSCAFKWMIDQVQALDDGLQTPALTFPNGFIESIEVNAQDIIHDAHTGFMKILLPRPRAIPKLDSTDDVFTGVAIRRKDVSANQGLYRPETQFQNKQATKDIYAKHPWYWTGIYLEKDQEYKFTAKGM